MIGDISARIPVQSEVQKTAALPAESGAPGTGESAAPSSGDSVNIGESSGKADETKLGKLHRLSRSAAKDTADFMDRHNGLHGVVKYTDQMLKSVKAFPSFIYPSLKSMTADEAKFVYDVMDTLPMKDVTSVKYIEMLPTIKDASGLAWRNPAIPFIQLSREQMNISPSWFREVVTHETGHTNDYGTALFGMFKHESASNQLWGQGPHISDYAKTNHWEDFAESYAAYHIKPDQLKEQCPEKFARLQELEKQGLFEKLVDHKAFRETGKFLGEKLGDVRYLRQGMSILSFAMGFLQIARGFGELEQGAQNSDARKKMNGAFDIVSGTCYASKVFCVPGLAIDGARHALDRAIEKHQITAEQGNYLAQHTVGIAGHVIARACNFVKTKVFRRPETPKPPAPVEPEQKISAGTIAKTVTIAAGGALGSLAGGMAGPYAGLMAGFSVAGPVGGVVGLVLGSVIGITAGNKIGGELGNLVGKVFVRHGHDRSPEEGETPDRVTESEAPHVSERAGEESVSEGPSETEQ